MDNCAKFHSIAFKMQKDLTRRSFLLQFGAGDGNRTRVSTLARLCSTIELHLQCFYIIAKLYLFLQEYF